MLGSASFTNDGRTLAFTAPSPTSLNEVFISTVTPFAPRQLTTMTDQVKGWTLGTREMISWTSQDGTIIEGVLIKPADFDPSKKYPLLTSFTAARPASIGRPSWTSRYYPIDIWAATAAR